MPDHNPSRWQPDRGPGATPGPPMAIAIGRGLVGRCPSCGRTKIFKGFLRVVNECAYCGAKLGSVRADDAPPYFTIFIVGHIVLTSMLIVERNLAPPLWVHEVIWLPVTLILALVLLRPVKGATVGLMLKLGMMKSATDD